MPFFQLITFFLIGIVGTLYTNDEGSHAAKQYAIDVISLDDSTHNPFLVRQSHIQLFGHIAPTDFVIYKQGQ